MSMSVETKEYEDGSMSFHYKFSEGDTEPETGIMRLQSTFHHDNPDIPCVDVTFGNKS